MSKSNFPKLLGPAFIGKVRLKNRIIKTAQGSSTIEPDTGFVGPRALAYYEALVAGGIGLLIVESCGVEYPLGVHHYPVQFRLHDDALIPSFAELAAVAHKHGCPIFLQLFHAGPWNPTGLLPKRDTKAASTLSERELPGPDFAAPRGMTLTEVKEHIDMFVKAAQRAHKAGFDGVEINGATCHLINTFFSRVWNRRDDQYGYATLENRARFMTDIVREIRKRIGPDFAVTCLINIAEYGHEKSTTVDEGVSFAKLSQEAGADAIQVRGHGYGHRGGLLHPDRLYYPELPESRPRDLDWNKSGKAVILPLAVAVKKAVTVPVIMAGRLDPVLGEKLLEEGKIDFVGMTRRLLADPELPIKLMEGRLEDIRPCLGCLYCMDTRLHNQPALCRVNPQLNRERELTYQPTQKKKRVLVIGGGPAGMEAARIAAMRGHDVTLYDQDTRLGGLLPLAAMLKDLEVNDIMSLVKYFRTQFNKLGVKVNLGQEITPAVVDELKPDVVIVAGGGKHTLPAVNGINGPKIISSAVLHGKLKSYLRFFSPGALAQMTKFYMPVGRRVIVIGCRIQGCEVAEFLVKRGRQVTIVDDVEALGEGMTGDDKFQLFPWFDKKGVKRYLGVKYNGISDRGLEITTKDGQKLTLAADTIITALPLEANAELMKNMAAKATEVYFIGDCKEPKLIADATAAGAIIANSI